MAITNEVDLTHIARTTEQWENTYDRNVIIPEGVLCIEFTPSGKTNIKIGDGHHIFSRLPYVNGSSEIIDCYTKQETDNRIIQILNNECVVRIKGILDDASKLPVHAACGDLWFVIRQNTEQGNKFEEYLYSSEHHWELIGGTPVDIDLSKYATKEYVDGKIRDIENKLHTHDNKSILDQITAAFTKEEKEKLKNLYNYDDTELRELIAKSLHTHSNKEVLDAITKYDIDKLRTLENYDDTLLKKKITALEKLAHEHSNKSILDKTTASFTTDYERLMSLIRLYIGATGFDDGAAGLVPPAKAGEQNYVLTGSGKWVPNTGGETYELPIASDTELGGIKIGEGLEISEDGTLSVVGGAGSGTGGNYNEGDGIKFKQETGKPLYRVLEYIEATGTQRIDTDILLTGTSHVVDITYQFTDVSVDNYLYTVGGIFDTGGQVYGILKTTVQELCSGVGQGGQAYNYVAVSPPTEKTSDTYFVNSTSFGSTLTGSKGHQIPILNDAISFFGFIRNTYTNYLGKVKLYGCTVKCDDVIKANFIPVMRISDNVSGLYDTVSKKFFTNTYNETPFVTGNPTEEVISDYITTINVKPATETEIGGVIIGDGINVDENGVISVDSSAAIDLKPGNGLEIVDVVNPEHTELPNGYGEISYLESLNGQYTIIDYVPNENTRVVCEFSYQESNVGDQCLFGTRTGNTSGSRQFVLWMEWDSSKPYTGFVYGGNNWGGADVPSDGYTLTCEIGQKMVADVSVNGYYLDDTLIHTVTNTGSPSAYKLAIFYLSNSNTTVESNKTAFKGRIYSFKIYENDVLVANLIPAIVMALNIPGFYDVINNKFYQSSTSNSFTYDASSVIIGSGKKQINLLPATMENIGGIIVGDGLSITEDGILSTTSEAGIQYEAGRAIEITDKMIPGDLTLDIFQDGTNWANGAYTSSTGNGFLPGYGASVHSPVGNVDSMFKVPDSTNRYRVEKRSVDGTQLSCTVSYIDAAGYRFAASPVWEDDDTTIHECPDGTVYITIGIRWLDHSSPISVSDIGVVNLVWIGAGESVENVKVINAQIATTETPGVVTVGNGLTVTEEGVISVDAIPLEPATADKLGGVKIGDGLSITEEGVLSVSDDINNSYHAGLGINITEEPIPGDIELDILNNEYAGWENFTYLWTGGAEYEETNYVLHTTRDRIVDESSGEWLTHFKLPDGIERIKVEAAAKDGTPLKFWIDNHDGETLYRWSLLGRWYDSGETTDYPDEYKPALLKYNYISIGLCFDTDNTRTISVDDIDYVRLYFIEADKENPKGTGKYINSNIATDYQLGGVIIGKGINVDKEGVISVDEIPLEPATADKLGGVKIGEGLSITEDGVLSVNGGASKDCVTDVSLKEESPGVISGNGSGLTTLNASNISSGTLSVDRLATSGATAGSYGPSANATPGYGSTFNVPYITVDAKGRVTAISTKTVKIPTSDNTDTNVKQSSTTTAEFRGVILGTNSTTSANDTRETTVTGQGYITNKIFAQPSTGSLCATNINAWVNGTAEVELGLIRIDNSSWRFLNSGGTLKLQNNYYNSTVHATWYNVAQFSYGGACAMELMTPPQITSTNRSTTYGYGGISMAICSKNSWAMGMSWLNNARDTIRGEFGAYGTADNLTYYYWGTAHNATKLRLYPGTGGGLVSQQSNGFRIAANGYGVIFRVDNDNFYILLTDKKTDGSELTGDNWNSKRPLQIGLSSGTCNINGNAESASKIYSTNTPGSSTIARYSVPFFDGPISSSPGSNDTAASGNKSVLHNNDFRMTLLEGTTSADGYVYLVLGNSIASGTAGNKYGKIALYSSSTYGVDIVPAKLTGDRTITLPDATGTVALTSHTHSYIPTSSAATLFSGTAAASITMTSMSGYTRLVVFCKNTSNSSYFTVELQCTTGYHYHAMTISPPPASQTSNSFYGLLFNLSSNTELSVSAGKYSVLSSSASISTGPTVHITKVIGYKF